MYRIGQGFDIHRICDTQDYQAVDSRTRVLVLGGVAIVESPYVAIGHSDADCLLHAIIDSLLGALALGDIGKHFPDHDQQYKGISSLVLLQNIYQLITDMRYFIVNLDTTVVLEKPKLAPYIDLIRNSIAVALNLDIAQVSVKAKTHEKVDAIGESKAISAQAVVLLQKIS